MAEKSKIAELKKAISEKRAELAAEYKAACAVLLAMHDTLKSAREEIGRMAEAEGYYPPTFAPVFTIGLDDRRLAVEKSDYIWLLGLENPVTGRAL